MFTSELRIMAAKHMYVKQRFIWGQETSILVMYDCKSD